MKKLLFLMVALLVAPAMATVTISVVDNGDLTADIVVTADGADTVDGLDLDSLVAGIGLDLSVDVGNIVAVTNFLTTGESIDGAEGYGIFMGTITFTGGDPEAIDDVGNPVAPGDAPDSPGQLPGPACVVELGCLYNVNTPEAAPLATTILCTVQVSEEATLTLGENATRGGVVLIGGGAPSEVVLEGGLVTGPTGPECWGYPCFPYGDANGDGSITSADITILIGGWNVYDECGDFNKDGSVTAADITILIGSWVDGCP